jgi:ribulose-5-phosphate 4-epimerase/fuculose-1-phosphate aldolase
VVPAPKLPAVSPQAEVALLARTLFREGYDEHLAGHITSRQPDGTFLVNPMGLPWDEVRASDVMRIDAEGHVLEGKWSVTPAIQLHVSIYRDRHDVNWTVHNHPRWGTIWADLQRVPPVYDQISAMVDGELKLYDDYRGLVVEESNAQAAAAALGDGNWALLANHGVLVVGGSLAQIHNRCVTLEFRCRQAWHVEAAGGAPPMRPEVAAELGARFDAIGFPGLLEAMLRRELRHDPCILD